MKQFDVYFTLRQTGQSLQMRVPAKNKLDAEKGPQKVWGYMNVNIKSVKGVK
jgi:hypothetical protein